MANRHLTAVLDKNIYAAAVEISFYSSRPTEHHSEESFTDIHVLHHFIHVLRHLDGGSSNLISCHKNSSSQQESQSKPNWFNHLGWNDTLILTKVVGIILAIVSGVLIGSSFVFKKKGLLRSQAGGVAGEGVGYLKSVSIFQLVCSITGTR